MIETPVAHPETVWAVLLLYCRSPHDISGMANRIRTLRLNVALHCPEK